jgi:hypothetical protein
MAVFETAFNNPDYFASAAAAEEAACCVASTQLSN